jgi:coatomer protein complex subunit epsilon
MQGGEKYQQAFYVFEELAQAPSTSSPQSLISQAVAEIHLGRLEEAEAALQQALAKDPKNADAIANSIVLNVIGGKDAKDLTLYVYVLQSFHRALLITTQRPPELGSKAPLPLRPTRKGIIV